MSQGCSFVWWGGCEKLSLFNSPIYSHTLFRTQPHTQTHSLELTQTNVLPLVFVLSKQDATHLAHRLTSPHAAPLGSGGARGPQQQCPRAEHAHAAYLKLYTILQNPGLVVVLPDGSSPGASSLSACGLLVDPCQLLHNLNDLIHGGFTLHATAVIDLGSGDRKLLGWGGRNPPTQPEEQTGACKERDGST